MVWRPRAAPFYYDYAVRSGMGLKLNYHPETDVVEVEAGSKPR